MRSIRKIGLPVGTLKRLSSNRVGCSRFQLVFSFEQRRIVLLLRQQAQNRFGLKVVVRNIFSPMSRGK